MTADELTRRVDVCLEAAQAAGKDYDYLVFGSDTLKLDNDGPSGTLGAYLSHLEAELAQLSLDLRTLPLVTA